MALTRWQLSQLKPDDKLCYLDGRGQIRWVTLMIKNRYLGYTYDHQAEGSFQSHDPKHTASNGKQFYRIHTMQDAQNLFRSEQDLRDYYTEVNMKAIKNDIRDFDVARKRLEKKFTEAAKLLKRVAEMDGSVAALGAAPSVVTGEVGVKKKDVEDDESE